MWLADEKSWKTASREEQLLFVVLMIAMVMLMAWIIKVLFNHLSEELGFGLRINFYQALVLKLLVMMLV